MAPTAGVCYLTSLTVPLGYTVDMSFHNRPSVFIITVLMVWVMFSHDDFPYTVRVRGTCGVQYCSTCFVTFVVLNDKLLLASAF